MALTFGAGSTDHVNCGSDTSLDGLTAITFLCWTYVTSLVDQARFYLKTGRFLALDATSGAVFVRHARATADTEYFSDNGIITTNIWKFLCYSFNASGSANEIINIYHGGLSTVASEVTYAARTDGSGGYDLDSAGSLLLGGGGTSNPTNGRIAVAAYVAKEMSLQEIIRWQFHPQVTPETRGFWHLGFNGTGTQPDWSGNVNNGSVTGATVSDHVPLGMPFGYSHKYHGNGSFIQPIRRWLLVR